MARVRKTRKTEVDDAREIEQQVIREILMRALNVLSPGSVEYGRILRSLMKLEKMRSAEIDREYRRWEKELAARLERIKRQFGEPTECDGEWTCLLPRSGDADTTEKH